MRKIFLWIIGVLAGLLFLVGWAIGHLPDGFLKVWVMDVGQGDAILVESPVGERILIDGGPDSTVLRRLGEILPFYEDRIDLIVLSHPHADHINGLAGVLQRYKVGAVLMTGVKYNYGTYDEFYRLLVERDVQVFYADGSHDFRLGKMGIDLVYPLKSLQGESFNNVNNSSIVLRIIYGRRRLLFSGDLEMEKEAELVKVNGLQLGADFLKAGHHGSKTSNTEEWVGRVRPSIVAISCGIDNEFKHPAPSTVERFWRAGARLWRTDIDGTIEVETDGAEFWLSRARGK